MLDPGLAPAGGSRYSRRRPRRTAISQHRTPRSLHAILLAAVLAAVAAPAAVACTATEASVPPPAAASTPAATATPAGGGWAESLLLSGDVAGALEQVLPPEAGGRSECSGRNSRHTGTWAGTIAGEIDGQPYDLLMTAAPYRGPGVYRPPDASVQVAKPDGSAVWQTSGTDSATFTIAADEESGTLEATLTDLSSQATRVRVAGRWSCRA